MFAAKESTPMKTDMINSMKKYNKSDTVREAWDTVQIQVILRKPPFKSRIQVRIVDSQLIFLLYFSINVVGLAIMRIG